MPPSMHPMHLGCTLAALVQSQPSLRHLLLQQFHLFALHPLLIFTGPLIRKYLLDNGHRVTVELRPDASLGDAIESDEQKRLAAAREAMGPADLDAVVAATKASVTLVHCNLADVHTAECPGCLGKL